jgi:hypothetical protein
VNPPPLGSLVLYRFGNSKVFGIITSITLPGEEQFYLIPSLFTLEIMETDGIKTWWDIHESDLLNGKFKVLQ